MSWKFAAASAAFLVVTSAQAHFKFSLAYGDASFAAMNNSSVGGQMANGSTVKVPLSGQSFRAQVWAEKVALRGSGDWENYYAGASALIAYDMAPWSSSTASTTSASSFLHKKVTALTASPSGSVTNYGAGFDAYNNNFGVTGSGFLRPLDVKFRGGFTNNAVSPRLAGLSPQVAVAGQDQQVGRNMRLMVGDRIRLFDVDLVSQMGLGQTYGFASGEAGLQAYVYSGSTGNPNGGATSFLDYHTRTERGMRVNLLAVPEPGSGAVLALGAMLLLRRKRR